MSVEMQERVIDIGDPKRQGMYRDFDTEVQTRLGRLIRGDGGNYRFRLVKRNDIDADTPFSDVNIEAADIAFGVGVADKEPSGGTFALSYNGSAVGLGALAWDISAATLQAALNGNAAVAAGGGSVTVTKFGSNFTISWNANGARFAFISNVSGLSPEMNDNAMLRVVIGDAGTKDVQLLRLRGKPYAFTGPDGWAAYNDDGYVMTDRQAGTTAKKCIRVVTFNTKPYDGDVVLNFPKPEVIRIAARANSTTAEVFTIGLNAGTFDTTVLNTKYFQVYDDVGPVNVWFNNTTIGGAGPATPSGGRNLAIAYLTADTINGVATKIAAAMQADAKFNAVQNATTTTVTATPAGARVSGPVDINAGTGGVILTELTAGVSGTVVGTYLFLQDADGTVGVWFSVGGSAMPAGALAYARQIEVPILDGDTANAVATAIATALDADAKFIAAAVANIVTATDADGGSRDDPGAGTTGMNVTVKQDGQALTVAFPFNSAAALIENGLDHYWTVRKRGFNYIFTCSVVGVQPAFDIDTTDLIYPNGITGALNLNTLGMIQAFTETNDDYITCVFEGEIKFPGEMPYTFYRESVSVYRDVIDIDSVAVPNPITTDSFFFTQNLTIAADIQLAMFPGILSAPVAKILVSLMGPTDGSGDLLTLSAYAAPGATDRCTIKVGGGGAPAAGYKAAILVSI